MAGGNCEGVANDEWYWIYYAAPFLAALFVAEATVWMEFNSDDTDDSTEEIVHPCAITSAKTASELFDEESQDVKHAVVGIARDSWKSF